MKVALPTLTERAKHLVAKAGTLAGLLTFLVVVRADTIHQSNFDIQLTKRIDFELDYRGIAANQDSGGVTHHATATLEIDLTRRLDLDLSFIWDHIGHPQAESSGAVPEQNDFRLNLSLGVKF